MEVIPRLVGACRWPPVEVCRDRGMEVIPRLVGGCRWQLVEVC